jgi:hypothetical protein
MSSEPVDRIAQVTASANTLRPGPQPRLWALVRTQWADGYWLLFIVSISVTVIVTRVYLELTGYPQVGDETYHIAHVLWGGLVMFIALVLPLSFANPYILWVSALLGGVGVGLFVDEVGKFITQSNDYFFPLAFPIIYAFILLCVWFFFRLRAHRPRDARTRLYHALEALKQVLDNDLDPFEHRELKLDLDYVMNNSTDAEERVLAAALLSFIHSRDVQLADTPTIVERYWHRARKISTQIPPYLVMRVILMLGFAYTGLNALLELIAITLLVTQGGRSALELALDNIVIISGKSQYIVNNPFLAGAHVLAIIVSGLLALVAAIMLLFGRDHLGVRLGTMSLAIALLIVNLLSFYFNQIYAILSTLGQVTLLLVAMLYRWRFLHTA